jgi:mannose-1-phosphate guanylyltransferase
MYRDVARRHRWGVILAGGEGVRLRSLTRFVAGDDRPKQFCPLIGRTTLLAQTRQRTARNMPPQRTLFVLLKAHERFYRQELGDVGPENLVVQPLNRGTLAAILYGLLRVVQLDQQAVVAILPSDHYFGEEDRLQAGLDLVFEAAEAEPYVILLGAAAKRAEVEYGWIEAEAAASTDPRRFLRVKHFWEKPSRRLAQNLLDRGCVWNTFVMVGRARVFLDLIRSRFPDLYQAFTRTAARCESGPDDAAMKALYGDLPAADFSKLVLSSATDRLGVFCLGDVGWSDLGNPSRVITTLSETGVQSDWINLWHRSAAAMSAAC